MLGELGQTALARRLPGAPLWPPTWQLINSHNLHSRLQPRTLCCSCGTGDLRVISVMIDTAWVIEVKAAIRLLPPAAHSDQCVHGFCSLDLDGYRACPSCSCSIMLLISSCNAGFLAPDCATSSATAANPRTCSPRGQLHCGMSARQIGLLAMPRMVFFSRMPVILSLSAGQRLHWAPTC